MQLLLWIQIFIKDLLAYVDLNKESTYMIVGSVEADALNNKISNESPLGAALIGNVVGKEVEVKVNNKIFKVLITKIEIK